MYYHAAIWLVTDMFLSRAFGRTLFAAARSEGSASSAAAAANAATQGHNPLQEFFEADRSPDDDKPVTYGANFALVLPTFIAWDFHLKDLKGIGKSSLGFELQTICYGGWRSFILNRSSSFSSHLFAFPSFFYLIFSDGNW